ncbi:MAG: hypothetical protein JXA77_12185 [Bacteroidales bacterium]|nr:hypothetical protein [Bacteroidales bacterium]MBN2821320.1 hypothetical protein [Bacteroidales bacterium]
MIYSREANKHDEKFVPILGAIKQTVPEFQVLYSIDFYRYFNVVVHADQHSANMKTKIKYWKIFNYHLKELTDNVDTKNANGMGAMRAMLILTPLLLITAFFEHLWLKIFGGNIDKYT